MRAKLLKSLSDRLHSGEFKPRITVVSDPSSSSWSYTQVVDERGGEAGRTARADAAEPSEVEIAS